MLILEYLLALPMLYKQKWLEHSWKGSGQSRVYALLGLDRLFGESLYVRSDCKWW